MLDAYCASGSGGQQIITADSAVLMAHILTGLVVVVMQDERSQYNDKLKALKVLRAKICEQERLNT